MVENMSALEPSMSCQQLLAIYQAHMGTYHLDGHLGWPYTTTGQCLYIRPTGLQGTQQMMSGVGKCSQEDHGGALVPKFEHLLKN